jgi:hypothetical protein
MKKLNETTSAKINVLGEGELDQVVGGYCHRKRHCGGGWYKPRYNHCQKSESYEPSYTEESSDESSDYNDYSEPSDASGGNSQVVNVSVSVNINQQQG